MHREIGPGIGDSDETKCKQESGAQSVRTDVFLESTWRYRDADLTGEKNHEENRSGLRI